MLERKLRDYQEQPLLFTKEEIEVQRGKATGPRSHRWKVPDTELSLRLPSPRAELSPVQGVTPAR